MNVYTTDKIRNVVLLGHSGSGKTSLVEAMAYLSGQTTRMGKVTDGNTISDYDKEEIKRTFSINTSVVPIIWGDTKINILDTPGFFDFVGEVEEAVAVADAAIIVVSGKAGIEVGTRKAWEMCEKYKLPRMVFVTDMDIDEASYRQVVADLQELYGKKIAPFHLPIRENEQFVGYVNVVQQTAKRWNDKGTVDKFDVPDYSKENLEINYPHEYVIYEDNAESSNGSAELLRILSYCKHFIIANCTFSWWGAWLCDNKNKTVFAPKPWFNSFTKESVLCKEKFSYNNYY